ncbi:MAG: hypothetical protein HY055_04255 [Magnetospirillum sp.]|nr:hypothetical protein [Magnetospirillum sp.]
MPIAAVAVVAVAARTAAAAGVSHGLVSGIGAIWQGKTVTTLSALGGTLLSGALGQDPWGYLTTRHPDKAIGYSGLAGIGFGPLDLGDSNSMPNFGFEAIGGSAAPPARIRYSAVTGHVDLQPLDLGSGIFGDDVAAILAGNQAQIAADIAAGKTPVWDTHISWAVKRLLTAPWGAQFPLAHVGALTVFSTYCQAYGFFMSASLDEARPTNEILNDWVTAAGAEFVWSGGVLEIVPYSLSPVTGNGVTYTPDPTPVYDLGPDDFVRADNDDPSPLVKVSRRKLADVYNRVKVEYLDSANAYNVAVAAAEDPAHIDTFGLREAPVIKAHQIQEGAVAQLAADLALARHMSVLTEYQFPLGWRHCRLEPMKDLVTLTYPESDLDHELVRVIKIEEDEDGRLTVDAEEVPEGISVPRARLTFQASTSFALDVNAAPGPANAPVLFEAPDGLAATGLEVWIGASGGPIWGGCYVWVSETGDSYAPVGHIVNPARTGHLAAALVAGNSPDLVNVLAVDLGESRGQLQAADLIDAQSLNTLCWVASPAGGGELLAYKDATLVGPDQYDLGYLVRGAFGTDIVAHPIGADFMRLDGAVFKYPFRADQIGKTILFKLQSHNIWGGGIEDRAQLQAYTYTIRGSALASPLPAVTGLTTAFVAGITNLTWATVTDFRSPIDYEVRQGPSFNSAQVIGRTPLTQAPTYGDGTYWVAAHYKLPGGGDVYSANPVSVVVTGSQLVSNVIAAYDEAATGWSGTVTGGQAVAGAIQLAGVGDILAVANVLALADLIYYGGFGTGYYTVPASHRINIGRVAPCAVAASVTIRGQSIHDNVLAVTDALSISDVTGFLLGPNVDASVQIRLSQDGTSWGAWQDWIPGTFSAMAFDFRVRIVSWDAQTIPVLSGFKFSVDVPDRTEDHAVILGAGAATIITYPGAAFNGSKGGQGVAPNPQITIVGAQAGDDLVLSGITLAGFSVQVVNGGAIVARTINYRSQGY